MRFVNCGSCVKLVFIILFSSLLSYSGYSQNSSSCEPPDDSKAVDFYKKGTNKKNQKEQRMPFLRQALQLEPDYVEANFAYGEELIKTAITKQASFAPAVPYFLKVIQQCPHYHSDPYYFVGFSYYEDEKYADALPYLQKFLSFKDDDEKKFSKDYDTYLYEAKQMLKFAKFYSDIFTHPVPFDPYPIKGLSTNRDEYLATITADNQYAYFTRKLPYSTMNSVVASDDNEKEYFMESQRQPDGNFSEGIKLPAPFNKGQNEGGPTLSIDNKSLYYTICKNEGGAKLNCDIYYTNYVNGQWTEIQNMGPQVNDPNSWDSQPSVSADGTTLFFVSDRPGGMGKYDIYKTIKDPQSGEWSPPINLGAPINTPGNDKSPFIHSDSHTLYFSSDGHLGIGGYDIFYSRADSAGNWKEPVNIGYPINSPGDDLGFFVSTDGKTGYFCSNDPNRTSGRSTGGWDIFQFALYSAARPDKVAIVTGKATTPDGKVATGATVTVTNSKTHKTAAVITDSATGTYTTAVALPEKDDEYVISVNKKGSTFNSGTITAKDTFAGKPVNKDFELKPVKVGSNYTLNNIYYTSNSAQLQKVSLTVIREFAKFLKANPTIKIKIAGYTDNVGNEHDNLALSNDRAFTVKQVLEQEGIKSDRVSFQGLGSANPVASNDTEEGRQKNRRTEFIILEK
ncbi:MAG TPA: OmpA family protein [Bacteroidia bacterium]|jgi:outer membrane protein OmpA-like peptidoglycan-associated protein|nr:OmpA family protein [Bacteroidia bacterium]